MTLYSVQKIRELHSIGKILSPTLRCGCNQEPISIDELLLKRTIDDELNHIPLPPTKQSKPTFQHDNKLTTKCRCAYYSPKHTRRPRVTYHLGGILNSKLQIPLIPTYEDQIGEQRTRSWVDQYGVKMMQALT